MSVNIQPQAHVSLALQKLADQITETEQKHPDSVLIILGEARFGFNIICFQTNTKVLSSEFWFLSSWLL